MSNDNKIPPILQNESNREFIRNLALKYGVEATAISLGLSAQEMRGLLLEMKSV